MDLLFPIKSTIDARRSARSFRMEPVAQDVIDAVKDFAGTMPVPFDHSVEIRFFHADPTKTLYSFMKSPPDNVAFLAETDTISISKVGFVGELLILFAQSKGLSTCWYGHYRLAELERLMPHLQSQDQMAESNMGYGYSKGETVGIRAICTTPLGYYEDNGLRLMDRITEKTISFKRKEVNELLVDKDVYSHLSDDVLFALDLGRKAPSAGNAQMWRFAFDDSFQTITIAMPPGYKHFKWEHPNVDIGICACHVWLGLLDKGYDPKVEVSEDAGRAVWKITMGDAKAEKKRIVIDFLYLDLSVCTRCQGTDTSLDEALAEVSKVLEASGVEVILNKINVESEELAIQHKFSSSPTIRVNGNDIQIDGKESLCESCGDLCGDDVDCRVWVYQGEEYTIPPKAMITKAILREVYGNDTTAKDEKEFALPENLKRFYDSMNSINRKDAGPFYHGTKADLKPGDLLEPQHCSNYGERAKANYVYLTATMDAAVWGAELAVGDGSGRIYQVEPTGPIEDDPNLTDKMFPGNPTRSYRTQQALRVVAEVLEWEGHDPEELEKMRNHLAELKRLGIEAIN